MPNLNSNFVVICTALLSSDYFAFACFAGFKSWEKLVQQMGSIEQNGSVHVRLWICEVRRSRKLTLLCLIRSNTAGSSVSHGPQLMACLAIPAIFAGLFTDSNLT